MTPRIPGYHFQPIIQPTIHPVIRPAFEPNITPMYMPENPYSPEKLSSYASAWDPKPTHPDYPFLPNYIPPKDNFNW